MKKKLCDTCIYRNNVEQLKPCIIYRDDCEHYKSDSEYEIWNGYHGQTIQPKGMFDKIWEDAKEESEEDMSEVGVEIVKTEETEKNEIKYLNINVSNSEVERKPDIVRLCADAGILEYVKTSGETVSLEAFKQVMWERDIAIGQLKELGYGFGQKIELCGDAISRQAVLDAIEELKKIHFDRVVVLNKVRDKVLELSSVNPQEPKTGHWIEIAQYADGKHKIECSECKSYIVDRGHANSFNVKNKYKYCPNCGARMIEPQESGDKCKNCEYYHNPDYTRCHKCKAESEGEE